MKSLIPSLRAQRRNLLILGLIMLVFSGCRSRKVEANKKVEKVSEIVQNDVLIENDITSTTDILRISNNKSLVLEPVDSQKTSQVIYKGDTLSFVNAKVSFGKSQETEKTSQTHQDKTVLQDNTSRKTESKTKEKTRKTETKAASWGLNIGLILGIIVLIIVGYFHFRTKGLSR